MKIPEVHKPIEEQKLVVSPEPPATPPPADSTVTRASSEAAPPVAPPPMPPAMAPTPPGGRIAATVQRMSPAGRWGLGLGLAFVGGIAYLLSPYSSAIPIGSALALLVMLVVALAAGIVLSSWWATLALAGATAAGVLVGSGVVVWTTPTGTGESPTGLMGALTLLVFFAILGLVPLLLFLLAGVGLGKQQGITLGQPHTLSTREVSVSRWVVAIAPLVGAGYLAPDLAYLPGMQADAWFLITGMLTALVLATTCLLTGWLLRSWWGLVLAPVVYAGVALLATVALPFFGGGGDWHVWPLGWALYIVLPAVVMSAIGTAIGMVRGRRDRS